MRYDLGHPSREPVLWQSIVKDGLVIVIGGLTVFDVFTPTDDQYAWLLTAFGFISVVVAVALREVVYSADRVEEEFLDAEAVINAGRDLEPEGSVSDPLVVDDTDYEYEDEDA